MVDPVLLQSALHSSRGGAPLETNVGSRKLVFKVGSNSIRFYTDCSHKFKKLQITNLKLQKSCIEMVHVRMMREDLTAKFSMF